jgi:hypothetical protein
MTQPNASEERGAEPGIAGVLRMIDQSFLPGPVYLSIDEANGLRHAAAALREVREALGQVGEAFRRWKRIEMIAEACEDDQREELLDILENMDAHAANVRAALTLLGQPDEGEEENDGKRS